MAPILMQITYRVRAHHLEEYEAVFSGQVLPLIRGHRMRFLGIWRTFVGDVGEYLELWEFDSMQEFERQWSGLMADPRLKAVFRTTGPMVEGERSVLFQPVVEENALK